jgi:hypothetical protein
MEYAAAVAKFRLGISGNDNHEIAMVALYSSGMGTRERVPNFARRGLPVPDLDVMKQAELAVPRGRARGFRHGPVRKSRRPGARPAQAATNAGALLQICCRCSKPSPPVPMKSCTSPRLRRRSAAAWFSRGAGAPLPPARASNAAAALPGLGRSWCSRRRVP